MKGQTSANVLYPELSYALRGVFYDVYNALGSGFREETYRQALMRELKRRNIIFRTQQEYPIEFKGEVIDVYRADLVIDDKIIVEIKAVTEMPKRFEAYLLSYLKASKLRVGYLVNFGSHEIQIVRRVL